jgi:beta-glucosidase
LNEVKSMQAFPDDFVWGVGTSAFQIEGAACEDGKSPSIWDTYVHASGRVKDGTNADVACDSYHRRRDDVRLMEYLGVGAYRFSLSWPRLIPDGVGALNPKGLDHYSALVDTLLERGITPFITLYHWDLPQVLEDRGGWQRREQAAIFADYAEKVVAKLGDRVKHWAPFNEIHAFVDQGYGGETKAPGLNLPKQEVRQVYHHVLLAQGLAARAMRALYPDLQIGTAENPGTTVPLIEDEAHIQAALKAWDHQIGFLFEPMVHGRYPDGLDHYPEVQDGDMETIAMDPDFLGLNIYCGVYVEPADEPPGYRVIRPPSHHPCATTETWLKVVPEAMYWGVRTALQKYGTRPVYITENGFPQPSIDDMAQDRDDVPRIMYLRAYLASLLRAIDEGMPVRGYFLWTLMDSFEWISGQNSRFGLFHTDFETLERSPRRSAMWYREVIARNRLM